MWVQSLSHNLKLKEKREEENKSTKLSGFAWSLKNVDIRMKFSRICLLTTGVTRNTFQSCARERKRKRYIGVRKPLDAQVSNGQLASRI